MEATAGRRMVSPRLVGRASELSTLRSVVLAPPAAVVVEGEAGIGKTRLLSELRRQPGLRDRRYVEGRCRRIREPFPLGPVIEAVRGLGPELAGSGSYLSPLAGALRPLLPELAEWLPPQPAPLADQSRSGSQASPDRAAERHRVFRALAEMLGVLGPAVLVLEDMHWVDEQTIDFVSYLLADPPPELSLVMSFRGEDVHPQVRALTAKLPEAVGRAEVVLRPLDRPDTGTLAAAILGVDRVPARLADHLHRYTSGLPFAVEELLALPRIRDTDVDLAAGLVVPTSIRDSVAERASRLSGDARLVLEAAAVLQEPGPEPLLMAASGSGGGLDEVLASGLLVDDGTAVGFRHLLAAQAVYASLSAPRRRRLHGLAADALRSSGPAALGPAPLGRVAHHLRRAGRLDEWAEVAEQAADQAIDLGHDAEAVRLLEGVLAHAPPLLAAAHRGALAVKLARAAIETAPVRTEVTGLLAGVLAGDLPRPARGELGFRLALLEEATGADPLRVRARYVDAVADLDSHHPQLSAWVMMGLAIPIGAGVPLAEHLDWLRRVLAVLPRIRERDPGFAIFLAGKAAMVLVLVGDPGWRELTGQITAATGGQPADRREVNAYQSVAMAACYVGHLEEADQLLRAALTSPATGESPKLAYRIRSALAVLDYCRGRWDRLGETVDELLDQLSDYPTGRVDVEVVAGCLALAGGDLARAQQRLAAAADEAEQVGGYELAALAVAGLARLAAVRGEPEAALPRVRGLLATAAAKQLPMAVVRLLPAAVQVLVASGYEAEAQTLWDGSARELGDGEAPLAPAVLPHARGFLAAAGGNHRMAAYQFLRAAAQYDRAGCGYEAAQAREQAAGCLFAAGDGPSTARAGRALGSALATYHELGAGWDLDRASAAARRHGVPVPARHRGGRRGYGDQLSPREREVAALAATGRTNREIAEVLFLSPKTVDKHIGAALRKLGLHSRSALIGRLTPSGKASPRDQISDSGH